MSIFGSKQNIDYVKKALTEDNFVVYGKDNVMFAEIKNITKRNDGFCGCSYYYWVVEKKHEETIEDIRDQEIKQKVLDELNLNLICWGYDERPGVQKYLNGEIPHPLTKKEAEELCKKEGV